MSLTLIDLHSHILPGIDDGAADLPAALALARDAVSRGTTHLMCTPHIHSGYFDNDLDSIAQAHEAFSQALSANGIALQTYYAAEVRISVDIIALHAQKKLPFLGKWNNNQVLLLELPHSHIPAGAEKLIAWLLRHQIQPVIAHPERNRDILADYNKARWLKGMGVLFQLTAGAFTGTFSEPVKHTAQQMLNDNIVDFVASDMHSMHRRPSELHSAYGLVADDVGKEQADALFFDTPWKIVSEWFAK